jgi:superfamily II DNA or RNA helicase
MPGPVSEPIQIPVPECWSALLEIDGNIARQLHVTAASLPVEDIEGVPSVRLPDGRVAPLRTSSSGLEPGERGLRVKRVEREEPKRLKSESQLSWVGDMRSDQPTTVTESHRDALVFRTDDPAAEQRGLRRPQIGALHAVLGFWTTRTDQPATVVLPTGTGKTDTMVALLVAAQMPRVLVLVPSDALRDQIAQKFETLGVLPVAGVVDPRARRPVVGRVAHAFTDRKGAQLFAQACNVIVATPQALNENAPEVLSALVGEATHLVVDEAHHVEARTWSAVRDLFEGRPVLQFTATPFREDGNKLAGRIIYEFPLHEAQTLGLFAPIDYHSIGDLGDPDTALAAAAVKRLREDLEAGFDHVLMARVKYKTRTEEVLAHYHELAPDLNPVVIHSGVGVRAGAERRAALLAGQSRIVICVDMLGEGFDLPTLKIAAIHDAHRSIGVTLQFVGRFARVAGAAIGRASAFVARPHAGYDPALRRLYAEDSDWNLVISEIAEQRVGEELELDEFEAGFENVPDLIPLNSLDLRNSAVVYKTATGSWSPEQLEVLYPREQLLTDGVVINHEENVAWLVVERRAPVKWADLETVEELTFEFIAVYWNPQRQLLYVNSSNNNGLLSEVAEAVCGPNVERIQGEDVYRIMHGLARAVPTNVGVLDTRDRLRRFSLHVGADVIEGFTEAEAQTKTKTNLFVVGYRDGERKSAGASQKGRIWSYEIAGSIRDWTKWCDACGARLLDSSISMDELMQGFIRPKLVTERPPLAVLALEMLEPLVTESESLRVGPPGQPVAPLIDCDFRITDPSRDGPIKLAVRAADVVAGYEITIDASGVHFTASGSELVVTSSRGRVRPLSKYLHEAEPLLLMEEDTVLQSNGLLLRPPRDIPPFSRERLEVRDWTDVDIRRESQGPDRDVTTVQGHIAASMLAEDWDLLVDDDGSGEIADLVACREADGRLHITLVHCKYSSEDDAGSRVADLYELCGQAQKSARWRGRSTMLFRQLIRRERNRMRKYGRRGLMRGTIQDLYRLDDEVPLLRPELEVRIVQPGLSAGRLTDAAAQLLASTELYVRETAAAPLVVVCSE